MNYKKELSEAFDLILNTERITILENWIAALPMSDKTFEVGGRVAIKIFPTNLGPEITAIDADSGAKLDLSLIDGEEW